MNKERIITATKTVTLDSETGWYPSAQRSTLNAYVLRCIQLHAGAVSSVPIIRTDTNVRVDIAQTVLYAADASLLLSGAAYLLPPNPKLKSSWRVLNPFTVSVKTDSARGIIGFIQRVGTQEQVFKREDLVYIRLWNPFDDLGPGIAPYEAAKGAVDVLDSAENFTRAFFVQGAIPPMIVKPSAGAVMSDADVNALAAAFRAVVSGVRNAWRALILRGDINVQALDMPALSNLAMKDVVEVSRQRIAVAFGIPQTLIEDAANYATAREHRISFWRETVIPAANNIASALSEQYYRRVYNTDVIVDVSAIETLQQDEATKASAVVQLFDAGIITRDEARTLLDIAPAETESQQDATTKSLKSTENEQPNLDKYIEKLEQKLIEILSQYSEKLADAIQSRQELSDEEKQRFRDAITAALRSNIEITIVDAVEKIAAQYQLFDDEMIIDVVDEFLQTYTIPDAVSDYTDKKTREILRKLASAEITNEEAITRLSTLFSESRAHTIAITEITRAYAAATLATQRMLQNADIETSLVWRTSSDELVCPICGPRNGKRQGNGWETPPPAHARCRCWLTLKINV